MHFLGLAGMPRRIPDYPDRYWFRNYVSSVGSITTLFGIFVFIFMLYRSYFWKKFYKDNTNFELYFSNHNRDFYIRNFFNEIFFYKQNNGILFVMPKYNFFYHHNTIFSYNTFIDNLM